MLETRVEKLEDARFQLTITLTPDEVDRHVADAYRDAGGRIRIPGFRAGKAPRQVIDNYVGRPVVLSRALESLVEESYPRAVAESDLRPMESPDTGDLDQLEEGQPYTFAVVVDVRPELKLSSTKGIKVYVPPSKATDREIEAQIDYLRDRFASLELVEGRGVEPDDFVLLSFTGTVDGEPYEDNVVDRYLYETGRGTMPPAFDEGLMGAKPGDERRIEFEVPDTSSNPDFVGKTAAFDVTVHEIKAKKLPDADDEFASSVGGFETVEELREDIRTRLDESKMTAHIRLVERAARGELVKRLEGDVPAHLVQSKERAMTSEFFDTLERRGVSIEEYVEATGVDTDQIRADIADEAQHAVADELALEALFRQADLVVTEEEVDEEISRMAETEDGNVATLRERFMEAGVMPMVRAHVERRRAVRWLMDNVEVVEKEDAPGEPETGRGLDDEGRE